jgi:hypothetical protein
MNQRKYTIEEISEYISGWAGGDTYESAQKIGAAVLSNALSQLNCEQDGIQAFFDRKKYYFELNEARQALKSAEEHNAKLQTLIEMEREQHAETLKRYSYEMVHANAREEYKKHMENSCLEYEYYIIAKQRAESAIEK